jgi:hypothetical protein
MSANGGRRFYLDAVRIVDEQYHQEVENTEHGRVYRPSLLVMAGQENDGE